MDLQDFGNREFSNYSQLQKECPRCGEQNDKCGLFVSNGFVMCRTDMANGEPPKYDASGWEYWPYDTHSKAEHAEQYEALCSALKLSTEDKASLLRRGMCEAAIECREYKTIPHGNGAEGLNQIIAAIDDNVDLDGVAGFYLKDGKRAINAKYKQTLIPVRNYAGQISQFVLRNNDDSLAKTKSKYILFSSDKKEDGARVTPQIHFPMNPSMCTHEVRITEGILKADVATELGGGVYCLGMHGLSSRGLMSAVNALQVSVVRIALDADWRTNKHVRRAMRRVYDLVKAEGHDVKIEEWNPEDGKGIDDVLLSGGKIWFMDEKEFEEITDMPVWNSDEHVFVNKTSQFIDISCKPFYIRDEKEFNNKFEKLMELFSREAKQQCKQVDGLSYKPMGDLICTDERQLSYVNLWSDTGIKAAENTDCGNLDFFMDHMDYLFQEDKNQKELMLDWMANIIQNRGKKFSYALVLHGEEGTGKTWMIHCLSLILGKSNVGNVSNEYINNGFNGLLEGKELLIINEIMAGGRRDFMNKMKDYIDSSEIMINKKNTPEYSIEFNSNWFMTTNHDDALLIDDKDRRYLVLSSDATCGDDKEAHARGTELFKWSGGGKERFDIQEGNISALHRFLMDREVGSSPFAKAPMTTAKRHMQEESLGQFEKFIKERIEEEMWPFNTDLVCVEHIKMLPEIEKRFSKISPHKWGKTLRQFGCAMYGSTIDSKGRVLKHERKKVAILSENKKQKTIWMIRRKSSYANLESSEISSLYAKKKPIAPEPSLAEEHPM